MDGDMNGDRKTAKGKETHAHRREKSWRLEEAPVGNAHTCMKTNTEACQARVGRWGHAAWLIIMPSSQRERQNHPKEPCRPKQTDSHKQDNRSRLRNARADSRHANSGIKGGNHAPAHPYQLPWPLSWGFW